MQDKFYTITAERPDLAAVDIGTQPGFIGSRLYPTVPVMEKSGVIYYLAVASIADATAQTGRSAGVAPTATQIAASNTTYTATELVKRGSIVPDEVKSLGGIEKADHIGARYAKRSVLRARELAIATQLLNRASSATFDGGKFTEQVQTILDGMELYTGRTAVVGSKLVFKRIIRGMLGDTKIGPMLARIVSGTESMTAARGLNIEQWGGALALYLGVDDVLMANDSIWYNGIVSAVSQTVADSLAVVKLDDDADILSHKVNPVLGKYYTFMPDGNQEFVVKSIRDDLNVNNHWDAFIWSNLVEFNAGAAAVITGVPN